MYTCGMWQGALECRSDAQLTEDDLPDGRFASVSAASYYLPPWSICVLAHEGTVHCWQRYHPNQTYRLTLSGEDFVSVSASPTYVCGVRSMGELWCSRYSDDDSDNSILIDGAYESVSVGLFYACAVRIGGLVECWSHDASYSFTWSRVVDPVTPPANVEFASVDVGKWHACGVLRVNANVMCRGDNYDYVEYCDPPACGLVRRTDYKGQAVPSLGKFKSVSSGATHTCGLRSDGTVQCWGESHAKASPPEGAFIAVSSVLSHTCGLRENGVIECWGNDEFVTAVREPALTVGTFVSISASAIFSCGLQTNGKIKCWN